MKQVWPDEWWRSVDRALSRRLGRIEPRRAATGWVFHPALRDAQFSCGFIMPQKAWLLNSRKRLPGRRIEYGPFFARLSLTPPVPANDGGAGAGTGAPQSRPQTGDTLLIKR